MGTHNWSAQFFKIIGGHPSGPGDLYDLMDCNLSSTVTGLILTEGVFIINSESWYSIGVFIDEYTGEKIIKRIISITVRVVKLTIHTFNTSNIYTSLYPILT